MAPLHISSCGESDSPDACMIFFITAAHLQQRLEQISGLPAEGLFLCWKDQQIWGAEPASSNQLIDAVSDSGGFRLFSALPVNRMYPRNKVFSVLYLLLLTGLTVLFAVLALLTGKRSYSPFDRLIAKLNISPNGKFRILKRNRYSIRNMEQLHALIRGLNRPKRRIVLALNGHTHLEGVCVREGGPMMNINSASNVWIGHQYAAVRYSETISRLYPHIKGCAPYWDVLFAVIEMDSNGIALTSRSSSYVGPGPYELSFPVQENYHKRSSCIRDRCFPMTPMEDTDHLE